MRRLRTTSPRRLWAIVAAVAVLAVTGGIAQAALSGADPKPQPKALDRAVHDAMTAPAVDGLTARVTFTNDLLPAGSLPEGSASPLAAGADGRVWVAADGRFRVELQSQAGDAQIVSDGERVSVYDGSANVVYRVALPAEERPAERRPTLDAVRTALRRLGAVFSVSGARPTSSAGRPSYTVRVSPKDDGGLLGAAELAWDAAKGVPLRAAVYAQGRTAPVLEVEVTDISYAAVPDADVTATPPAGARVADVDPRATDHRGRPVEVRGVRAVQRRLDFDLAAPDELAGLPRRSVSLVRMDGQAGALSVYGQGLGAVLVFQRKAGEAKPAGRDALKLPQVNIDGATGTELATALGTMLSFERDGVAYAVVGSVPPVAAENAARSLR